MRSRARSGVPAAAAAPGTACPAASSSTGLRLIAAMLVFAAALDLTRCSLVVMTFRHVAPAVGLVAAGIGAAVVSVTAALGYRAGRRWAAWAALVIGVASAPQASASGFRDPFTIPDVATAALGVLLTVAILATAGRGRAAGPGPRNPMREVEGWQPRRHAEFGNDAVVRYLEAFAGRLDQLAEPDPRRRTERVSPEGG